MKPTPEAQATIPGIHTRLLSRPQDPPTSKAAARELVRSGRLTGSQEQALACLLAHGPGTTHELAKKAVRLDLNTDGGLDRAMGIHYELARRLPELARKSRARVQQDRTKPCRCKPGARECHCQDVIREGCRVWEAVKEGK